MDENTIPKSPEELAFDEMNTALESIKDKRSVLIDQLLETARTTKIDFENDAPRKTEMKLSLMKTVDDLLKSQESLYTGKVKINLQKKSEETNEGIKKMAVEILRNINMNQHANAPVSTTANDEENLKKAFDDMVNDDPDKSIKDSELEIPDTK